jgi:uncharacterized membrane protein YbhN (UPF0104 family)
MTIQQWERIVSDNGKNDSARAPRPRNHRRNLSARPFYRLATYVVALSIIWCLARNVSVGQLLHNFSIANPWIFVPASAGSFTVWFVGETFLFATLFSCFHTRTSFREMMPVNAAQYFLQLVNTAVAGAALVMFMHRRKGVAWLSGGCTLIFQTVLDFQIMAAMALIVAVLDPSSLTRKFWLVPAMILMLLPLNLWFWMRGRPVSALGQWVYDRPSLISFRTARPLHYLKLSAIRTVIFLAYGAMLYLQIRGFRIKVHPADAFAILPAVLLVDGLPMTPVGLGLVQAVLVSGLAAYASRARLLAMALSISFMNIAFQAPLGLGSAGTFAREITAAGSLTG